MSDCLDWPQAVVTGETSIRFQFGTGAAVNEETYQKVSGFSRMVEQDSYYLLEEVVPSFHTVTVYLKKEPQDIKEVIQRFLSKWQVVGESELLQLPERKITIPVCYDESYSLDMERVMESSKLSREEVIALHTHTTYTVYIMGFLPGFPYLGKLDERLATPRRPTPRFKVEKGTVGIGGHQTGVYPLDSPGGWNIIGKTPLDLFRPDREEPFLIQAGDRLEFHPIPILEYQDLRQEMDKSPEAVQRFIKSEL